MSKGEKIYWGVVAVILFFPLMLGVFKKPPLSSTETPNGIVIDKLFEHEGCKTFRFSDSGMNRYYTVCNTGQVGTNHQHAERL